MQTVKAEVITIGDEILFGQITDTNTQWIGAELSKIGIRVVRKSSVGDTEDVILAVLKEAEQRADVILITGGLGPTKDDITKTTLTNYFDTTLEINEEALMQVTQYFTRRGRILSGINRQQAALPVGSTYLPNTRGTAPGMWFERNGKVFISMPGVPHEMKGLMTDEVLPRLKKAYKTPIIFHKYVHTIGIGESNLAEKIEDWEDALPPHIRLAYLPSLGTVKLRLTATGNDLATLETEVDTQIEGLKPLIQPFIFGYENAELVTVIGKLLNAAQQTVSVAESCTGGYLAHQITRFAGSSAYFQGGVVSYSNEAKMQFLGVRPETLDAHGAVSEETIREMAEGVRQRFGTAYGLATSGIAGPDGGTETKPVGTVWVAVATPESTMTRRLQLGGTREQNIHLSALNVLNMLRKALLHEENN
ncbi:MAG: competence/damage-inducible protein A [Cytophagaceae bacterium]|nr:competence/damage-inducible protein A [Cytophagaceae bacterium]